MVTQLEVDVLDRTLRDIITTRLKPFIGSPLDSRSVAAMAAVAQTALFDAGQQAGYDWRDIHFKIEIESLKSVVIGPIALSLHAEELLDEVLEKYHPTRCNANCIEMGEQDYDCPAHGYEAMARQDDWGGRGEGVLP